MKGNWTMFRRGLRDGIAVGLGYFTVAVSLGIAMQVAGITALQGGIMSASNMTSAGQFAGTTVIAAGSGYLVMAVMELADERLKASIQNSSSMNSLLGSNPTVCTTYTSCPRTFSLMRT